MIHCAAPRRCTAQAGTEQISKSGAGIRASLQSTSVINLSSRQEINNIPNMRAALLDDAPRCSMPTPTYLSYLKTLQSPGVFLLQLQG